jgi:ubiquinone/menaquinone biosynthesis C-methylase UbiE
VERKVKLAGKLPGYSADLAAFHRAHRHELRQIISDLELPAGARVLDLACGDGTYSQWLSDQVGERGSVIGVDLSPAFLSLARTNCGKRGNFLIASALSLPFAACSFDMTWCAQSLISLPEPRAVLGEMLRVLRPGGQAVVLENDSLHELILPWPEELELAIRAAQWRAYRATKHRPEKRYLGRRLSALMRCAGLSDIKRRTYATDRVAPLGDSERKFLESYLQKLRETVWTCLSTRYQRMFDRWVQHDSPRFILKQPDFEMTWLDVVCVGRKLRE